MSLKSKHRSRSRDAVVQPFQPLKPGEIEPTGWLRDVAQTAANGITGHLDERSPVFRDGWKGIEIKAPWVEPGGVGWPIEQCAYWFDGLVRLAYILKDPVLIAKARARLDPVVEGVLKAEGTTSFIHWMPMYVLESVFNGWAHSHMGRALVAYYKASGDRRILKALVKVYQQYPLGKFPDHFLDVTGFVNLDPLLETLSLTGDKLLREKALAAAQTPELNRVAEDWRQSKVPTGHGVIFNENIRVPALLYPLTGNKYLLESTRRAIEWGDRLHRLPMGVVSSEEYHAGVGSTRNVETCDVSAAIWTYHWMLRITGSVEYADRIEEIFFNAAPVPVSRDYQTMSYYQSPNRFQKLPQDEPSHPGKGAYQFTPLGFSTLCCVANLNRIVPNYILHQWMTTPDGGLAATLYGPCRLNASVADGKIPVTVDSQTHYPFEETIRLTITPSCPTTFPLYLRLPAWCKKPTVKVNGQSVAIKPETTGFLKIDRKWKAGDKITLRFPMSVRVASGRETPFPDLSYYRFKTSRPLAQLKKVNNPFGCVHYGPLLFALPIKDDAPNLAASGAKWNYALDVDPKRATEAIEVRRSPMPAHWHWALEAPLRLRVPAVEFNWRPAELTPLPAKPVAGKKKVHIELVPYGCTKFRISMFPVTPKTLNHV